LQVQVLPRLPESISWNSSGYPGSTKPTGLTNTLGRLIEAATDDCDTDDAILTDEYFSYDADGRLTDVYESTPNSGGYYHTSASYYANGALNTLTGVPTLNGWTFGVDGEGRPYSATYGTTNWVKSATYYPSNPQTIVTYGVGTTPDTDVYSFDSNTGRMTQFTFTVGSTPKSLTGTVSWNANGTLGGLGLTDQLNGANTQNCSYVYDDLARASGVNCVNGSTNVWNQNFTLDAFGNISKSGTSSFAASYLLSNGTTNNQQQSVGSCTPTYDANGDLTKDCSFVTPETYTWNQYGSPATLNGVTITYDALGREVEIGSSSSYSQILYSPIGKLGVMKGQTPVVTHFPLPGGSTAQIMGANGPDYTQHSDWLGSSRLTTALNNRSLIHDVAYAPFGENYAGSGTVTDGLDFTGQFQDTIPGLYDFLSREYNPVQGRWISPDPAGLAAADPTNPQSWNRYAYVGNNPLSRIDPLGLEDVSCDDDGGCDGGGGGGGGGDGGGGDGGGGGPIQGPVTVVNVTATPIVTVVTVVDVTASAPDPVDELNSDLGSFLPGANPGSNPFANGGIINKASSNPTLQQTCLNKVQSAVNAALNTQTIYTGPTQGISDPNLGPGARGGAFNYNFLAPGYSAGPIGPGAIPGANCGRFPNSGSGSLHLPVPGGGCNPSGDPTVFANVNGGFQFTAHIDSANPFDDLASLVEHIINNVIRKVPHGC
jgi:RHS repeat-associated protein